MAPVDVGAGLLFAAIAEAEIHLSVLAFRERDLRRYHLRLLPFRHVRLDVRELEGLEHVELTLTVFNLAQSVGKALPVGQLAQHHRITDAAVAHDFDRTVAGELPGSRLNRENPLVVRAALPIRQPHGCVGIALISHGIEHRFAGRLGQRSIERLPDFQWNPPFQAKETSRRQEIESREIDSLDERRLPLLDVHRDVDGVLLLVQLHVERRDSGAWIPTIAIKRDDPFQVGVELLPGEIVLLAPGEFRALNGGEDRAQLSMIDGLYARELQPVNADRLVLQAPGKGCAEAQRHKADACKPNNRRQTAGPAVHGKGRNTSRANSRDAVEQMRCGERIAPGECLLVGNGGFAAGDRQHDAESNRDHEADGDPHSRHMS